MYFVFLHIYLKLNGFYITLIVFKTINFSQILWNCQLIMIIKLSYDYVLISIKQKYWSFRMKLYVCNLKRFSAINSHIIWFCSHNTDFQKISYYRLSSQFVNPISFNVH